MSTAHEPGLRLTLAATNDYCSLGWNVNTSCRQCLRRTLQAAGIDADAYDAEALAATARQRSKAHRQAHFIPGDVVSAHRSRLRNYGITADEYAALLQEQQGVCALCGGPETSIVKGTVKALAVDHHHGSGKVRGLLCGKCNSGLHYIEALGMEWARRAQDYLDRSIQPEQRRAICHASPPADPPADHQVAAVLARLNG